MEKKLELICEKAEVLIRQTEINQTIDIFRDFFTTLAGNLTLIKGVKLANRHIYFNKIKTTIEEIKAKVPPDINRAEEITHISIQEMEGMLNVIMLILEESNSINEQILFVEKIENAIMEYNNFLNKFDQMAQILNDHFVQKFNKLLNN